MQEFVDHIGKLTENVSNMTTALRTMSVSLEAKSDYDKRINDLEKSHIVTSKNVEHIKERLDNGVAPTLEKAVGLLEKLAPKIEDNTYWVGAIKRGFVWITTIAVGGGLVSVIFFALRGKM